MDEEERVVPFVAGLVQSRPPQSDCAAVDVEAGGQAAGQLPGSVSGRYDADLHGRLGQLPLQRRDIEQRLRRPRRHGDANDRTGSLWVKDMVGQPRRDDG